MMIRLLGVALLVVSAGALWLLRQIVEAPPSMLGVAVSLLVVSTGIAGGNLLLVGPRLFQSTRVD